MRGVLIVLVLLAVAAVLFVAAVVATQEGDVLLDAPPDRADVDLPAGHVVAEDLRSVRFGMVLRGYRMSEVDDVLARLGDELAERDERIADLERALVEVVEPAVQEAEARHGAPAVEAPEPGLPPSLAPPLAQGARDGEAPAETPTPAPASGEASPEAPAPAQASEEDEVTPVPEEWVAAAAAPAEPEPAAASPLDPGWEPSAVERTLDLAASYRLTMPRGGTPLERPAPEPESQAEAEPEAAGSAVPEEDEGFPEVEPAEPAARWAPEAREDTGDEQREQGRTQEP
jgi:DivIVA domain-containing protein